MESKIKITNENSYKAFLLPKIEHYNTNSRKIKSVRLKMISHDEEYEKRKAEGTLIEITNPEYEVGKTGRKTLDGIFSPLFGPDNANDAPVFTCECRQTTGSARSGQICPHCGTPVRSIEADLKIVGYINIYPYYILTYHGINALSKLMKPIDAIWNTSSKIDLKGKMVTDTKPSIMELYNDYDEKYYPLTGLKKKYAFCSKIPVYSAKLRPFIKKGMSVQVLDVNTKYNSIVTMRRHLLSLSGLNATLPVQRNLNQIQADFVAICKYITGQLGGKTGIIRRFMASGRIDYSSRMVITLGPTLMPHEIDIPYQTFMVIYEEEIINRYSKLNQCSVAKALKAYRKAIYYYDRVFANIMNDMCKTGKGVWALINRNPTLNEMGIPFMKVRKIHDDYDDYTLHLPPDILTPLGADLAKAAELSPSRSAMRVISYKNNTVNVLSTVCAVSICMLTVSSTIMLDVA